MSELYIGLMSGTSADGIDAVLVDFSSNKTQFIGGISHSFNDLTRNAIHQLADSRHCTLEELGELDATLGLTFARCAQDLLKHLNVKPSEICAIGSHGQTVRHQPPHQNRPGFTLQIGDPNQIAQATGITTVADFRRRDMAAGGQGAPLAPAYHQWALHSSETNRAVVNIGGMSNLTWLATDQEAYGYDLGPGNVLMDSWIQKQLGHSYDKDGQWASSGTVNENLLLKLLEHPFLQQLAPKSTGREAFNLAWLESILMDLPAIKPVDTQATLCAFTARTIRDACSHLTANELYICGGGAKNSHLMNTLKKQLPNWNVQPTDYLGVDSQWVEAIAFAWLARETLAKRPGNLCAVTGAKHPVILGAVYY